MFFHALTGFYWSLDCLFSEAAEYEGPVADEVSMLPCFSGVEKVLLVARIFIF